MEKIGVRIEGIDEDILLFDAKKINEVADGRQKAIDILFNTVRSPKGNAFMQLQTFRKYVPKLINLSLAQNKHWTHRLKKMKDLKMRCFLGVEKDGQRKKIRCL